MSLASGILSFMASFVLLIIAMTVHESFHGWTAYKLGDTTAKYSGRLTLNPMAHIDPVWTILIPLLLFISSGGQLIFGAAKPVPINYWALKNPKRDIIWVGASGPLSNLIFAFLLSILLKIPLPLVLYFIIVNLIVINLVLGVFNLIPIPPLDGSRILMGLLPEGAALRYAQIEPYGFIIVIILVWLGVFGRIIWPLIEFLLKLLGIS